MQPPFDNLEGVTQTVVGFTGGDVEDPTWELVYSGTTGHVEGILVTFDRSKVNYETLLETFWRNIDPTQADGQFNDRGTCYQTAIFYHNEEQRELADRSKAQLERSGKFNGKIQTKILPAGPFYAAEDFHQEYYIKSADHYNAYKEGSGRGPFLRKVWGK